MDKKKMTVRDMAGQTGMSSKTIQRAVSNETIHKCELGTLARIGSALGVKTKRLYDEVDEDDGAGKG